MDIRLPYFTGLIKDFSGIFFCRLLNDFTPLSALETKYIPRALRRLYLQIKGFLAARFFHVYFICSSLISGLQRYYA